MTNEELKAARIEEAHNIWSKAKTSESALSILADLYETNWQPVDKDTLAAREWIKTVYPSSVLGVDAGDWDKHDSVKAFKAGLAHARTEVLNADDVTELVAAAREVCSAHGFGPGHRLRKAFLKFST